MKIIKKILKILGWVLIGLILAAAIVPYVFKDKIVEGVKEELNAALNAKVDFTNVSLSLFSSFPDVEISIDSLSIVGIDTFSGIHLLDIVKTSFSVSLPSLIKENVPYKINSISAEKPVLQLIVSKDSLKNWDIIKESEGTASYVIELDQYGLSNGQLTYIDRASAIRMSLENISHSGKGNFTPTNYDLNTKTSSDKVNLAMDGVSYIHNANAVLDAIINIDVVNQKYSLKENKLDLNDLQVEANGDFQFIGDNIDINLNFTTPSDDFKSFLSIVPYAYSKDFKNVTANGTANLTGSISGRYNKQTLPGFDFNIRVQNGSVKYPDLPKSITDINAAVLIKANQGNYQDLSVDISNFSMALDKEIIKGHMSVKKATIDPSVKGALNGKINLQAWKESFPADLIDQLSGIIDVNLAFDANLNDVNQKNYDKIILNGYLKANNLVVKAQSYPIVTIAHAEMNANPKNMEMSATEISMGKSRMNVNGSVSNPLSYFTNEGQMEGKLAVNASLLDFNELNANSKPSSKSGTNTLTASELNTFENASIEVTMDADKILYEQHVIQNAKLNGRFNGGELDINQMDMVIDKSDISMNGKFRNIENYLINEDTLVGQLNFRSKSLDLNPFMTSTSTTTNQKAIVIPGNVKLTMNAVIDKLTYTNYILSNLSGDMVISDATAELTNVRTSTMGGKIAFDGLYSSSNSSAPYFSFKFDLSQISFVEAFKNINTFNKLAPIAKYLEGFFNSTLVMSGNLGDNMIPDFSSLDASGYLETINSNLTGDNPLYKIGNKLGIDALTKISLEESRNWFEVVDGMLELKPVNWKVQDINMKLGGRHGLGKDMDYYINMTVPRKLLESNKLTSLASEGISFFEKQATKLGLDVKEGGDIVFDIKLTGKLANPSITIKPAGISGTSASNAVKDAVNEKFNSVKDSLTNEAIKAKNKAIDSLKTKTKTAVDSVKTVINKEVEKAVDSIKVKLENEIRKTVSDSLKNAANDVLKDIIKPNSSTEIDSIKSKLEEWNPFKKKKKKGGN